MSVTVNKAEKDPTKQQQESDDASEFQWKKSKDSSTNVKQVDDDDIVISKVRKRS